MSQTNTKLHWVDSHCHLDFPAFDRDRVTVLNQCIEAGLHRILVPGVVSAQWSQLQPLAESFDSIFFSVGIHPWWLKSVDLQKINAETLDTETLDTEVLDTEALDISTVEAMFEKFIRHPKCVAIGECGLDGAIDLSMAAQCEWLSMQLNVAQENNLPVILHSHRAHNELVNQLKKVSLKRGGVVHAFSGSIQMAEEFIQMGFKLGIGGTITYERAQKTRNAVSILPLESLLLETDAPDMPIMGFQGQRNSPEKILLIAQELAKLRGETVELIAEQTTTNAKLLFGF